MTSAEHWESVHTGKAADDVSWWQQRDDLWLDLITDLQLAPDDPIIDVGAGSSLLPDALIDAGFTDVTVLDVSPAALARTRERLGDAVQYRVGDVLQAPLARYALWYDRAVFHFLTEPEQQRRYAEVLHAALSGTAIIATFAPDGPQTCSGLPVARYTPEEIAETLGLRLLRSGRRVHVTPWGAEQPFSIAVLAP